MAGAVAQRDRHRSAAAVDPRLRRAVAGGEDLHPLGTYPEPGSDRRLGRPAAEPPVRPPRRDAQPGQGPALAAARASRRRAGRQRGSAGASPGRPSSPLAFSRVRSMPRCTASIRYGRSRAGATVPLMEPIRTARATSWIASKRAANAPRCSAQHLRPQRRAFLAQLLARGALGLLTDARRAPRCAGPRGRACSTSRRRRRRRPARRRSPRRGRPRARPSRAVGLSCCENTTNAPPW